MIDYIINTFGYFGIAFLIAVENIFPPIPSEVILTLGGFLTTTHKGMNIPEVIIASTIGSLMGAIVLFSFGLYFSEEKVYAFIDSKWGKRLGFKHDDLTKAINWFNKWGKAGVFFGRCVPIIRSIISIPAGMVKMNWGEFLIFTTIGSAIWNTILVIAGAYLGERRYIILELLDQYKMVAVVIFGVIGLYFVYLWLDRIRKEKITSK
jgi:membrane protein DedA with SNARE-associated domain